MTLGKMNRDIPLIAVQVESTIRDLNAKIRITQAWKNNKSNDLEIIYRFSLPKGASLCNFHANVNGKMIRCDIIEKKRAEEKYDDALASGHGAFMLRESAGGFEMSVGSLQAGKEVLIVLEYVTQLFFSSHDRVYLELPILPVTDSSSVLPNLLTNSLFASFLGKKPASYSFDIEMASKILSVDSESHQLVKEIWAKSDGRSFELELKSLQSFGYENVRVSIQLDKPFDPTCLVEKNTRGDLTACLTFHPDLSVQQETFSEFIFLVDCSGSMSGTPMESVKKSLHIFLRSLPDSCYFNIVDFGSNYRSLFNDSRRYDEDSLKAAIKNVDEKEADLGGTDLARPLQFILKKKVVKEGYSRQIFLLTDGQVDNADKCFQIAKEKAMNTRIFTFGIGSGVDKGLVKILAEVTHGQCEIIEHGSRYEQFIMKQLLRAMKPAITDIKLDLEGEGSDKIKITPFYPPPVFEGGQVVSYLRLESEDMKPMKVLKAVLTGKIGSNSFNQDIHVDFTNLKTCNKREEELLSPLYGSFAIKDLQDRTSFLHKITGELKPNVSNERVKQEIISTSTRNGVISNETAFVGVEEREEATVGTTQLVEVSNRRVDAQIAEIREIISQNISTILNRADTLDDLEQKTESLRESAVSFRRNSNNISFNPFSGALNFISNSVSGLFAKPITHEESFRYTSQNETTGKLSVEQKPVQEGNNNNLVEKLIKTQNAKGSFGRECLSLLKVDLESLKKSVHPLEMNEEMLDVCIAILVCSYLENKCQSDSVVWTLIVNKSRNWIRNELSRQNLSENQFGGVVDIVNSLN